MSANALATLPGPAGPLDAMLPSTDTIACQAINAWLQKYAGELRWDAAGRSYSSCWEAPLVAEMRVAVELTFGVRSVMLAVDHLAALSPLLVGEPFMHMPVALRDMILHRLLSQLFVALPGPLRDSVDVRATHWGVAALSQWSCVLGFTLSQLSSGAASRCIVATRSAADLDWLRSSLPSRTTPMPRLRSSLRLPMR
ncbi:MAG TPA: hypothetical protein VKB34_06025, partial [Povalibacter sp.]|nr:hypothetical protein [Povalibacter sp.]